MGMDVEIENLNGYDSVNIKIKNAFNIHGSIRCVDIQISIRKRNTTQMRNTSNYNVYI